ncbi:MAG: hypothetical protein ACYDAR_05765 [Thermomicrobiales bacterium]
MTHEHETVDISNNPDLLRLAEEVRRRNTSTVLKNGDEDVAVMMPVAEVTKPKVKRSTPKKKSAADMEAFFSSFGGWNDVDTDRLKADIYESRRRSTGPSPEL